MKAFEFELESVLRLNLWKEEGAQKALKYAVNLFRSMEENIRTLEEEMLLLYQRRGEKAELSAERQMQYLLYQSDLTDRIEDKKKELRKQRREVLQKTALLQMAIKERKKLEKLKEKRVQEFRRERNKRDIKILDEVSSNMRREVAL